MRPVHSSIFNSNSKILSNKSKPARCRVNLAKEVYKNMRASMRASKQNSFSEVFSTSPRIGTMCTSAYLNQKTGNHIKVGNISFLSVKLVYTGD